MTLAPSSADIFWRLQSSRRYVSVAHPAAKEKSQSQWKKLANQNKCLTSESLLLSSLDPDFGGGSGLDLLSGPVELGLGHSVSKVDVLGPGLLGVSSTLDVEIGVIFEDTGLGDVSLVVGFLLAGFLLAEGGVVLGGQAIGNVRSLGDLTDLQL